MNYIDMAIQEDHVHELKQLIFPTDGTEGAAYVLCGRVNIGSDPWERRSRTRYLVHTVVPIPASDMVSASNQHVTWGTDSFVRLLKRAELEGLVIGVVHSHPTGPAAFSVQDDKNEAELALLARRRNGSDASMISVVVTGDGHIRARIWTEAALPLDVDSVRVVGRHLKFHQLTGNKSGLSAEAWARQALAFGPELNGILHGLKVGIVGGGGTGSAVAMLLARLGVAQLAIFDDDIVEATNLGRLHGARQQDADGMRPKVEVIGREIASLGLGIRVIPIQHWVGDPHCRDALRSCDIIFGCTDDHDGRMLLNRLAYFYLIPVVDMGLAIEPLLEDGRLGDLTGRVTVLTPQAPCLLCRGIVDPSRARDEDLRRREPQEYERRKREAYVRGQNNPAPAVVTFTTATACLAIDELLQALTNFRGGDGWAWQRVRRFDILADRRPGATQSPSCPVCVDKDYWGRGDVDPFLDRVG